MNIPEKVPFLIKKACLEVHRRYPSLEHSNIGYCQGVSIMICRLLNLDVEEAIDSLKTCSINEIEYTYVCYKGYNIDMTARQFSKEIDYPLIWSGEIHPLLK